MTRTLIALDIDGKTEVTTAGAALILGRTPDEIRANIDPTIGVSSLPTEWLRDGQRRSREAQAHTNSTNALWAFQYWAAQHGNTIDTDDDHRVWMVTPEDNHREQTDQDQQAPPRTAPQGRPHTGTEPANATQDINAPQGGGDGPSQISIPDPCGIASRGACIASGNPTGSGPVCAGRRCCEDSQNGR